MKVKFVPQNVEFEIAPGQSVLHVAQDHGIYIKSVCKGVPNCAECRVRVTEGEHNVMPPGSEELSLIGTGHFIDRRRLSCQLKCFGDITVDMTEQLAKEQSILVGKKKKLAVKDDRVEQAVARRSEEPGDAGYSSDLEEGTEANQNTSAEISPRELRAPREPRPGQQQRSNRNGPREGAQRDGRQQNENQNQNRPQGEARGPRPQGQQQSRPGGPAPQQHQRPPQPQRPQQSRPQGDDPQISGEGPHGENSLGPRKRRRRRGKGGGGGSAQGGGGPQGPPSRPQTN